MLTTSLSWINNEVNFSNCCSSPLFISQTTLIILVFTACDEAFCWCLDLHPPLPHLFLLHRHKHMNKWRSDWIERLAPPSVWYQILWVLWIRLVLTLCDLWHVEVRSTCWPRCLVVPETSEWCVEVRRPAMRGRTGSVTPFGSLVHMNVRIQPSPAEHLIRRRQWLNVVADWCSCWDQMN